jgi:cyclopropane fatty-acyl-phospholipid synthase-like methyltransferase
MTVKPDAPAARSNREAILSVLQQEFGAARDVLEIGSGTGQHAVFFARAMPELTWQTSDRAENLAGIIAWIRDAGAGNVRDPIRLDVLYDPLPAAPYDAVFSANTAHIMSVEAVAAMFRIVGAILHGGGLFCLYGPFNIAGEFTSDSNRRFDASLKAQNPAMGVRDIEALENLARANGMRLARRYAMPANNMVLVWEK